MWCFQGRSCQNIEFEVEKRKGEAGEIGQGQIIMVFLCDDEFLKLACLCSCSLNGIFCPE